MRRLVTLFCVLWAGLLQAQQPASAYQQLLNFLPNGIEGFVNTGNDNGYDVDNPGASYAQAKKILKRDKSELIFMLSDYKKAPKLYNSITNIWSSESPYEDDHIKVAFTEIRGHRARVNIRKQENAAEVILAINGRYILSIQTINASVQTAEKIALALDYSKLP